MYDSPEAGRLVTVTVWEIDNPNGIIYTPKEETARYNNCTHKLCECGKPMGKFYTKCESCRQISARERYLKLPFKEWDFKEPVVVVDGDDYFFNLDDLNDYMDENHMEEIDLLICEPIKYSCIDTETLASEAHEDWEPTRELELKIKEFNDYIKSLPPHSWMPGKVRTTYKIKAGSAFC
jgi:hypothetical protein